MGALSRIFRENGGISPAKSSCRMTSAQMSATTSRMLSESPMVGCPGDCQPAADGRWNQ